MSPHSDPFGADETLSIAEGLIDLSHISTTIHVPGFRSVHQQLCEIRAKLRVICENLTLTLSLADSADETLSIAEGLSDLSKKFYYNSCTWLTVCSSITLRNPRKTPRNLRESILNHFLADTADETLSNAEGG